MTRSIKRFAPHQPDAVLLEAVSAFYVEKLAGDERTLEYLRSLGLADGRALRDLGLCNRTLGLQLPEANRKVGAALRNQLMRLGVLRSSGHEHLRGCITLAVRNADGVIVDMLGFPLGLRRGDIYPTLSLSGTVPSEEAQQSLGARLVQGPEIDSVHPARLLDHREPRPGAPSSEGAQVVHQEPQAASRERKPLRVKVKTTVVPAEPIVARVHVVKDEEPEPVRVRVAVPPPEREPDAVVLERVVEHYVRTLEGHIDAQRYLVEHGLALAAKPFRIGFCDHSLSTRLPPASNPTGKALREQLARLDVIDETGREALHGYLSVPLTDARGAVVALAGHRVSERADRSGHIVPTSGVFNREGLGVEVIVAGTVADALALWCGGYRHVTLATADLPAALRTAGTERVILATDMDVAALEGLAVYRVRVPSGLEVGTYGREAEDPDALGALLRGAEWIAGPKPAQAQAQRPVAPAEERTPPEPKPDIDVADNEVRLTFDDRSWRIRGIEHNLGHNRLRVNLRVLRRDRFHVDSIELYRARERATFTKQASIELGLEEAVIKRDLGKLLVHIEQLHDERIRAAQEPSRSAVTLTDAERDEALALLRDPNLLERIAADVARCGIVGEAINAQVGYLAAVSRKLDDPLAILIQSSSAAGKTSLMDAVLSFAPEEDRLAFSAMTGQSLYYLGHADLAHKILAVAEEEGVQQASYALKLLQSQGELTIASTGKDAVTGRLVAQEYRVKGPVSIFMTSTAIDIDEELLNRCIVLTVDEGREQTRAIHALQRRKQTLEGLIEAEQREQTLKVHRNAQRLLEPLHVVNPFADRLTFSDHQTRTRRDHAKYLSLIQAIALLHQHQREIRETHVAGQTLRYVEATEADIAIANHLAHAVLGRSLDELPPQTRRLLNELHDLITVESERQDISRSELRFQRRWVRDRLGWGDTQLKVHLRRLVELEYLLPHRMPERRGMTYELLYDGQGQAGERFLVGLCDERTAEHSNGRASGGLWSAQGRLVVDLE